MGRGGLSCSLAFNGSTVFVSNKKPSPSARTLSNQTKLRFVVLIHLLRQNKKDDNIRYHLFYGGQGWIRTTVVSRRQIYSLLPLATRAPTHRFSILNCQILLCMCSDCRIIEGFSLEKRYLIFFLRSLCLRAYSGTYR